LFTSLHWNKILNIEQIPYVPVCSAWAILSTPAYCYYATDPDLIKKWRALYNWYVVSPANPKQIAPTGWRVPTDTDWEALETFLIANGYNYDGTTTNNKIAKSMATQTDWYQTTYAGAIGNNLSANNSSGFSALPGGYRTTSGDFFYWGHDGYWWAATECDASDYADNSSLYYENSFLGRSNSFKICGFSVRLVRNLNCK
jgi:uncharacterized protein (TIGR02145 family)